jgi:hypothetical protein
MKQQRYKPKARQCKNPKCKEVFNLKYSTLQKFCSFKCEKEHDMIELEKGIDADIKQMKENLKGYSWWIGKLQETFNEFIRLRDKDLPCISCGTKSKDIQYHAGHFFSVGNYPCLRIDEDNVHKQCGNSCNKFKSGNLLEYAIKLKEKIGEERFNALYERRNGTLKLSIPEIKEKITYYKIQIKKLNVTVIP